MVLVEVVLVLGITNYPTSKLILAGAGIMRGLGHIKVIAHNSLWCHIGEMIIELKLPIILH